MKRTQVGNFNDRYANIETGYLLQRFEEYEGIAVLATDFFNNIDEAFKRRLKFMIRFTLPDTGMRRHLWKSMISEAAVVDETIDLDRFA